MKRLLYAASIFIICYIFWVLAALSAPEAVSPVEVYAGGIIVCLIISYISSIFFIKDNAFSLLYPKRLGAFIVFIGYYILHMVKAHCNIAMKAFSPKINITPGILKLKTDYKDEKALAMLERCITLCPGTIVMDTVEESGSSCMYVHCIEVQGKDTKAINAAIAEKYEPRFGRIFK